MTSSISSGSNSSRLPVYPVLSEYVAQGELAQEIETRSTPYSRTVDGILFREGDPPTRLYLLKKGEIMLTMHSADREVMRVRAGTGSLIGLPAVVSNEPYSLTATASVDAEIRQISREEFYNLVENRPRLCLDVLRILAAETRSVRKALADFLSSQP
jgi:CRP-like cAMP-binding protein